MSTFISRTRFVLNGIPSHVVCAGCGQRVENGKTAIAIVRFPKVKDSDWGDEEFDPPSIGEMGFDFSEFPSITCTLPDNLTWSSDPEVLFYHPRGCGVVVQRSWRRIGGNAYGGKAQR